MSWTSPASAIDMPAHSASGVNITLSHIVAGSKSIFTAEADFYKWPGEFWSMQFNLPPLAEQDDADDWIAFAMKLEGMYGTFLCGDPSRKTPRGAGGGTPLVNGGGQNGNNLVIDGCPANTPKWLKKGDYFQLGTGASSRLYKLTADANTDSGGNVTLEFSPTLRSSPVDNAALTITSARGLFRMSSNDVAWSIDSDRFTSFSFTAVEAL